MEQGKHKITLVYPWDNNGYCPKVAFFPELTETGFRMHIEVQEQNPKRVMTEHFQPVHLDSCVEWFVNFSPETSEYYFNFEVNANGIMNVAFRKDRYEYRAMTAEDIELLGIKTKIGSKQWSVDYEVSFSLIKKYFTDFEEKEEATIRTNFYKCGDETEFAHYGVWKEIDVPEPDFHRPEYFGELVLRKEK